MINKKSSFVLYLMDQRALFLHITSFCAIFYKEFQNATAETFVPASTHLFYAFCQNTMDVDLSICIS